MDKKKNSGADSKENASGKFTLPNKQAIQSNGTDVIEQISNSPQHQLTELFDSEELFRVLTEVRKGNFSVRMPVDQPGVSGNICDALNDFFSLSEQMFEEIKLLEMEITERKSSEEKTNLLNLQLLQNIIKLEEANNDLDRVVFMASHDLQEPLHKILMFNDRLYQQLKDVLNEESVNYINRIRTTALQLQRLIKDIMTFSRISTEKSDFVICDSRKLVMEILNDMGEVIKEKNARINVDALPELFINPNLFRPLFCNLINNALKYSKKDVSPEIKIYADKQYLIPPDQESNNNTKYHRIYVEDNGIGFDQKYSDQIFMMFKRLHHKNEFEGTGIGLALCKKIVEEHNGFISAKSVLNSGSTFVISIPVHETTPMPESVPGMTNS